MSELGWNRKTCFITVAWSGLCKYYQSCRSWITFDISQKRTLPAGKQHQNDVVSTSMRRDHVASTLIRRHFNVVCPLDWLLNWIWATTWENVLSWTRTFVYKIDRINRNVRKRTFGHLHPTKTQISLRMRAVWSESSLSAWRDWILGYQNAASEYSDQTARMRRLIWIFAGRRCPKVRFLTLRLIPSLVNECSCLNSRSNCLL